MKKAMMLGLMLSLAAMSGSGAFSTASARETRGKDFTGVWRLEHRQSDFDRDWDRDRGGFRDRDWDRDANVRGRRGRGGNGMSAGNLPDVIRIERGRRELRVESRNGQLLRTLETGRNGDWRGNRLMSQRHFGGMQITEVYTLRERGRELVVRTIVNGPRGQREFTSVYDRA